MPSELTALQPTTRFSNRVENYVKYRPSYPKAIVSFLEESFGINKQHVIADIGSGTGIFSELFLEKGYRVTGIEPNEHMRLAAESRLGHFEGFRSNNQQAEDTGLADGTVDLITVAQAFHWMEPEATKLEFDRILRPGGHIVLAWNLRRKHTAFLRDFDALKKSFALESRITSMPDEEVINLFYEPRTLMTRNFSNVQSLDFDSLKGQLLSASYIPLPGHPSYDTMISELVRLFVTHNEGGFVKMEFETRLYINI